MLGTTPSILLFDCSEALESKLKRQGFDVESGTTGHCTGVRKLPSQIYEKNVIIYNPSELKKSSEGDYFKPHLINDLTPEFSLNLIHSHVSKGAVVLAFIKEAADEQTAVRQAYSWLPAMPSPDLTSDMKPVATSLKGTPFSFLSPIISESYVKTPIKQKLPVSALGRHNFRLLTLYENLNNDTLGLYAAVGKGKVVLLPDCNSNEEIISIFFKKSSPKHF